MKDSYWAVLMIVLGVIAITFIYFFQNVTNTDQQNYTLLRETTEAAMYDSIDKAEYAKTGNIKIDGEKFVEVFVRRFSASASLSNTYIIDIYDISEYPPKVTLRVRSTTTSNVNNKLVSFKIDNKLSAILETPY